MQTILSPGTLWIVATPIGNLDDFSPRARHILESVPLIAAEDTRHSAVLLRHFGISTRVVAFHEHNERAESERLVEWLREGKDLALICDAGTPLISDPGFRLVRAARAAGLAVSPVPGPCAAIAALSVAGLPSDRFIFEGFLPTKTTARCAYLKTLCDETRTLVFYESSHRLRETVADLMTVFGTERQAVIARELTKRFETLLSGTLSGLATQIDADINHERGEFVLVVAGAAETTTEINLSEGRRVFEILRVELPPSRAAKLAAEITGVSRKTLYANPAKC